MRILRLEQTDEARGIVLRSLVGETEFEQLCGQLDDLCVFASKLINTRATVIKTGARHSFAKYLLFPVSLRRQFKTSSYDFQALACGAIRYRDTLYIIYGVPRSICAETPATLSTISSQDGTAPE